MEHDFKFKPLQNPYFGHSVTVHTSDGNYVYPFIHTDEDCAVELHVDNTWTVSTDADGKTILTSPHIRLPFGVKDITIKLVR